MADAADRAGDVIEQNLAQALANRPNWIGIDLAATECDDCGNEIPQARRHAAPWATTCVECQNLRERRDKHVVR